MYATATLLGKFAWENYLTCIINPIVVNRRDGNMSGIIVIMRMFLIADVDVKGD